MEIQLSEDEVNAALSAFRALSRYAKEINGELLLVWHGSMVRNQVTSDEFRWAVEKLVDEATDFPMPGDVLKLIRGRRSRMASIPFADPRTAVEAPALPSDGGVTVEEHRARKAAMELRMKKLDEQQQAHQASVREQVEVARVRGRGTDQRLTGGGI